MPRQPEVRSNDPNKRNQNRGRTSAFAGLDADPVDMPMQYTTSDPNLIKNNTTADQFEVGRTFAKVEGESTWSQLSNLLGAGMKAAEVGVGIYAARKEEAEKKQKERDLELDREAAKDVALTWAQTQDSDLYKSKDEAGRLEMQKQHHAMFADRFVTDDARFQHELRGMELDLMTDEVDAQQWWKDNVQKKVTAVELEPGIEPEVAADRIAKIYEKATEMAKAKFGDDTVIMDDMMDRLAGGVTAADRGVKTAARDLLADYDIQGAAGRVMESFQNGNDPLIPTGEVVSSQAEISKVILAEAGIDLDALDPDQANYVIQEARELLKPQMERYSERVGVAQDNAIIEKNTQRFNADLAEIVRPDQTSMVTEETFDSAMQHLQNLEENTNIPPVTLDQRRMELLKVALGQAATRTGFNLDEDGRKTAMKGIIDGMMAEWKWDKPDADERVKRLKAEAEALWDDSKYDALEKSIEDKNDLRIREIAAKDMGDRGEAALDIYVEKVGNATTDHVGVSFLRSWDSMGEAIPFNMAPLKDHGGRNRAAQAIRAAYRDAMANGTDFREVLFEELSDTGRVDIWENREGILAVAESMEIMTLLDKVNQFRDTETGSVDQRMRLVDDLESAFISMGGSYEGANQELSFSQQTDAEKARYMVSGEKGGKEAFRQVGIAVKEKVGSPPSYRSDPEGFAENANMFTRTLLETPGVSFALKGLPKDDIIKALTPLYEDHFLVAPSSAALEGIAEMISEGAFLDSDSYSAFVDLGKDMAQEQRSRDNKSLVDKTTWDNPNNWSNVPLELKAFIVRNAGVEAGRQIDLVAANTAIASRGIIIQKSGDNKSDKYEVVPNPEYNGHDIFAATDDGQADEGVGARRRSLAMSPAAKSSLTDFRDRLRTTVEAGGGREDIEVFAAVADSMLTPASGGFLFTSERREIPGLPEEYQDTVDVLVDRLQVLGLGHNISHGRMALASALLDEGIPISDEDEGAWSQSAFDAAEESMQRMSDGSIRFSIKDANGGTKYVYASPEFEGIYGGVEASTEYSGSVDARGNPVGDVMAALYAHRAADDAAHRKLVKEQGYAVPGKTTGADPTYRYNAPITLEQVNRARRKRGMKAYSETEWKSRQKFVSPFE